MFDQDASTYWCDNCGGEMVIDYQTSTDARLILRCSRDCGETTAYLREVQSVDEGN